MFGEPTGLYCKVHNILLYQVTGGVTGVPMRRIPSTYLSPSGAGTRVPLIIRPANITRKVIGFIAELADKGDLLVNGLQMPGRPFIRGKLAGITGFGIDPTEEFDTVP
jgi:hypothetical protein